jgi:protein-tyrosine phosphatase
MPKLLSVKDMPKVDGVKIPWDFYMVMDNPLFAGMCYPYSGTSWDSLAKAGFSGVVCLCERRPKYDPYPLHLLYATMLEDLFSGYRPRDPEGEEKRVRKAVEVVARGLRNGDGIIVHCLGGIGRTGTVIGCVLRELGYSADEAIGYLDEVNIDRRIGPWSDSEWQAEMVRKY